MWAELLRPGRHRRRALRVPSIGSLGRGRRADPARGAFRLRLERGDEDLGLEREAVPSGAESGCRDLECEAVLALLRLGGDEEAAVRVAADDREHPLAVLVVGLHLCISEREGSGTLHDAAGPDPGAGSGEGERGQEEASGKTHGTVSRGSLRFQVSSFKWTNQKPETRNPETLSRPIATAASPSSFSSPRRRGRRTRRAGPTCARAGPAAGRAGPS